MSIRIIPRLDVKGSNVVKGIHFEGLRVVGTPNEFASAYYLGGADEILYMDSVASLYGRNNLHEIVARAAANIFIPLTVGGGVRSVEDARSLLRAGADKVVVNTALFANPDLINAIADTFGSQCMVVSIDAVEINGNYECLTDGGRERTGVGVEAWVENIVERGAGEILLTSVDKEGTGRGFDNDLVRRVAENAPVPVVACGGAGCCNDIAKVIQYAKADAVSVASLFHYHLMTDIDRSECVEGGNTDFLKRMPAMNGILRSGLEPCSISELKRFLSDMNIDIRATGSFV